MLHYVPHSVLYTALPILAECLLPTHMLEWFELTNVDVKPKENTVTQDTQSEESPVNVIHLYLDENNLTPDKIVKICVLTALLLSLL